MKITVTQAENGMTIKKYLESHRYSARLITRLKAKENGITVNGEHRTVRWVLETGDVLGLEIEDSHPSENITLSHKPVRVIYEDDRYIAVEKPPHLPIHPSRRHLDNTLASRVMAHFNGNFVFRALTRLDLDTSGAVLIAKDQIAAQRFSEMLAKREVTKEYIAFCDGVFSPTEGIIEHNIRRERPGGMMRLAVPKGIGGGECSPEGMESLSRYRVLREGNDCCKVLFMPVTGRTHQLRVHSLAEGHPIVGDTLYSSPSPYIDRQALHAHSLSFVHPFTGDAVKIVCPLPEDMIICEKELFGDETEKL